MRYSGRSGYQDDTSDEALLAGIALSDDRAGLVFVRRYQHRLFGVAIRIVGDPRLAEEVTQEAFIRIFRHAEVFDARRASVSAWAFTIVRNLSIDVLRVRRDISIDPDDQLFLALMSKESGLVVPLLVLAYACLERPRIPRLPGARARTSGGRTSPRTDPSSCRLRTAQRAGRHRSLSRNA